MPSIFNALTVLDERLWVLFCSQEEAPSQGSGSLIKVIITVHSCRVCGIQNKEKCYVSPDSCNSAASPEHVASL